MGRYNIIIPPPISIIFRLDKTIEKKARAQERVDPLTGREQQDKISQALTRTAISMTTASKQNDPSKRKEARIAATNNEN